MKNFLIAFSIFLVWTFFALWLYSWTDTSATAMTPAIEKSIDTTPPSLELETISEEKNDSTTADTIPQTTFENTKEIERNYSGITAVTKSSAMLFSFDEGITITENLGTVSVPSNISDYKNRIKVFLDENPSQEVHIEAIYSPTEIFDSPNLGKQRGNSIKRELMSVGVAPEKILVKSIIGDIEFNENRTFNYGVNFMFSDFDTTRVVKESFVIPDMITVYPKFSGDGIQVNEQLTQLLNEVVRITSENPNIRIRVVGHTDNVGDANDNYRSGLKFARQVRWYLANKGNIDRNTIIARSEGEGQAIATNKTERGRNLNRRIEVYFAAKNNE